MRFTVAGIYLIWISALTSIAQSYDHTSVFAHNDYDQPVPFYRAYSLQVGFIEADIFLRGDQLMVAHHQNEIKVGRTLDSLYLIPLQREIRKNNGSAYVDAGLSLVLMIDLKTEGTSTLKKLADKLSQYNELITAKNFQVAISGNVPDPDQWKNYPTFIHFDGRPNINYSDEQLARVTLISNSFGNYSHWDGKGSIPKEDRKKIEAVVKSVHVRGKKLRFWGAPDFENGWQTLMKLKVDVIGSDHVPDLVAYLKK